MVLQAVLLADTDYRLVALVALYLKSVLSADTGLELAALPVRKW